MEIINLTDKIKSSRDPILAANSLILFNSYLELPKINFGVDVKNLEIEKKKEVKKTLIEEFRGCIRNGC